MANAGRETSLSSTPPWNDNDYFSVVQCQNGIAKDKGIREANLLLPVTAPSELLWPNQTLESSHTRRGDSAKRSENWMPLCTTLEPNIHNI